jgi:hypothetical protein
MLPSINSNVLALNNFVSSAKSLATFCTNGTSGNSFMYIVNNMGPKTLSWGQSSQNVPATVYFHIFAG